MQNLSRAVNIGINQKATSRPKQTTLDSSPLIGFLLDGQFVVKKGSLGSIAFFDAFNLYANLLTLGSKFLPKFAIRNRDKVLVVALANINSLLDPREVPDNNCTDVIFNAVISDILDRTVEIIVNLIGAFTAQVKHFIGNMGVPLQVFNTLQSRIFFVVPLVNTFEVTSVNDKGRPRGRIKGCGKVVKPHVDRQIVGFGQLFRLYLLLVNILNIKFFATKDWNNPNLLQLGNLDVLGQSEDKFFNFGLIDFTKSFREADVNKSILDPGRPTLNCNRSQNLFLFVMRQFDLSRIFTLGFKPEKSKKGFHITVNDLQNLLAAIGQKQTVIFVCLALVVILDVRQILSIIKVKLSDRVQAHVIEASRMITHRGDQIELMVSQFKSIFLSKYHYLHIDIVYENGNFVKIVLLLEKGVRFSAGQFLPRMNPGVSLPEKTYDYLFMEDIMGIKSKIGYIDSSTNPFRGCEGCELWNPKIGIKTCYAGRMIGRFAGTSHAWPEEFAKPIFVPGQLEKTYNWADLTGGNRDDKPWLNGYPRVIFVNDMSDSFMKNIRRPNGTTMVKESLSVDWLTDYMPDLTNSPHIYMFLTKRPSRAVEFFQDYWGSVPSNFWVGTSVTGPKTFGRAVELTKLAPICDGKLWLSLEPLYDSVDLAFVLPAYDWIVVGGESGISPTVTNLDIFNFIRDDCIRGDTPLFVKQLGSGQGYGSKGEDWNLWPNHLKVRQMPGK